jgi:hypothetical protein
MSRPFRLRDDRAQRNACSYGPQFRRRRERAGEPIVVKLWLKLLDPRAPGGGRAGDSASQTEIRTTASNNGSGYGGGRGARQLSSPLSSFRGSRGEI